MTSQPSIRADLHIHTTCSDGLLTPEQVVSQAIAQHLDVIAITDHDALDGVIPAQNAARGSQLRVLSGIELSAQTLGSEVHILGYFINPLDEGLQGALAGLQQARLTRAQEMLERLKALGLPLNWQALLEETPGQALGRPHIAAAMQRAGYVDSIQQAFSVYLGRGGAAYVPRAKVSPEDAIQLIERAGGLAVLAHPWYDQHLVPSLREAGLRGLEAYYSGYTGDMSAALMLLARQQGLLVTCGSDFHGLERTPNNLLGGVAMPPDAFEAFLAAEPARP
ncbi:MAG: PHP domain-containing protein [Chloroflexi bacterium]|nr:PHP domain-containing protein [Chloroflexota bacterium]